ncbi:hypothetical protein [Paracoccus aestuariivivens]|uniref:Uncharacterized protein n=1 Tax=Paracoccus aestuariivivens TaxID=1820333 RepID=A0A6L6JDW4_9RHOB|nr:hypothetical protein [Paracoccus aestuariivivens]MTH80180.1 hypothetical protein [Paracoccus aestuariivivens]
MFDSYLTTEAAKHHLDAARKATLQHVAISEEAAALRDALLPELREARGRAEGARSRKPQAKELVAQEQTLDAILADLILASANAEALGYCYRSSNREAFTSERTKATSRIYDWQLKAMVDLGLADIRKGRAWIEAWDDGVAVLNPKASRIRATPRLLELALSHGITTQSLYSHYVKDRGVLNSPVVLMPEKQSGGKPKPLPLPKNSKVSELVDEVERINSIYARHTFSDIPFPEVRRVFNLADTETFNFNKGGRLYGDFQSVKREQRKQILIDGLPVVELDIKASQLTILHHITKTRLPEGDLYQVEGLPRPVVKAAVTAMIGQGKTELVRWPKGARESLISELGLGDLPKAISTRYPINTITKQIAGKVPALRRLVPGTLDWADLQYTESQVLIQAILALGESHNIPALPLHDGILIPAKDVEAGRNCLAEAFSQVVGGSAIIETK